jgi:hypothetical protein
MLFYHAGQRPRPPQQQQLQRPPPQLLLLLLPLLLPLQQPQQRKLHIFILVPCHLPRLTFAQTTFVQKTLAHKYICTYNICTEDICPERHLLRKDLPRRLVSRIGHKSAYNWVRLSQRKAKMIFSLSQYTWLYLILQTPCHSTHTHASSTIHLLGKHVLLGKCRSGQMSFWANVFQRKCVPRQMSFWANFFWANIFLGKCLSGQISFWADVF